MPARSLSLSSLLPLVAAASTAVVAAFAAAPARAQAYLSFSGGSNTPLTISLLSPVTYTANGTNTNRIFFVFEGVNLGNTTAYNLDTLTGTMTFTVNDGPAQTINILRQRQAVNDFSLDDMPVFSTNNIPLASGAVIRLTSGTLTTISPFAGAAPAAGTFTTFITRDNANRVSANGVSSAPVAVVPEPGTVGLLALGLVGGAGAAASRRRRAA